MGQPLVEGRGRSSLRDSSSSLVGIRPNSSYNNDKTMKNFEIVFINFTFFSLLMLV